MSKIQFIKNRHEIRSYPGWKKEAEFKKQGKLIDENNLPVGEDYRGKRYRLVEKQVRFFSPLQIALRKVSGLVLIFLSCGILYTSPRLRKFMAKRKTSLYIALLVEPTKGDVKDSARLKIQKKPEWKIPGLASLLESEENNIEKLPLLLAFSVRLEDPINKPLSLKFFKEEERNRFLSIPLLAFIDKENPSNPYASLLNDPMASVAIAAITMRIDLLDQAVQLKERLKNIGDCGLTLGDLLKGWKDSPLKYALASKEEFSGLTLRDMKGIEPEFVERVIQKRLIHLAAKSQEKLDPSIVSSAYLQNLPLIHIYKLEAKWVNQWIGNLPPCAFCLLSDSAIKELNTKKISEEQVEILFLSERRVHLLSTNQIDRCLDKILPRLFKCLSDEQIFALNFVHLNQEVFNVIFKESERGIALLQALNPPQLSQLYRYFNPEDWEKLKEEQILSLDYNLISEEAFKSIFENPSISSLFQKLAPLNIQLTMKYFTPWHWSKLTNEQLLKLDFAEIKPEILRSFFTESTRGDLVKSLTIDQIHQAYPYFRIDHWSQLSQKHILLFDFVKYPITQEVFNNLFSRDEEAKWNLLEKLSLNRVTALSQYFTKGDWAKLSLEVLCQFDYSQIDQAIFDEIFAQQHSNFQARIQALPLEKLYQLFLYFSEGHWDALTDEQVLGFDYFKLETEENFNKMWPIQSARTRRLLPKLTSEAFIKAHSFLDGERIGLLTNKQKVWIEDAMKRKKAAQKEKPLENSEDTLKDKEKAP